MNVNIICEISKGSENIGFDGYYAGIWCADSEYDMVSNILINICCSLLQKCKQISKLSYQRDSAVIIGPRLSLFHIFVLNCF